MSSYARITASERSSPARVCRHPTVNVLHGGDPGRDHLEGGVERVEIEIEMRRSPAAWRTKFERHVGRTELNRRQADVVVAVDEAG